MPCRRNPLFRVAGGNQGRIVEGWQMRLTELIEKLVAIESKIAGTDGDR